MLFHTILHVLISNIENSKSLLVQNSVVYASPLASSHINASAVNTPVKYLPFNKDTAKRNVLLSPQPQQV